MKKLIVYTDWWSRWNPWISWIWIYIIDENWKEIEKNYKSLWIKTNNEAEYLWAYYWIKRAIEIWCDIIELRMDSSLVINQLSWEWKIKKYELMQINKQILNLIEISWLSLIYKWIKREENKEADRLSNIAMDKNEF